MRYIHTPQSSFWEDFSPVFIWGYFFSHHRLQSNTECSFSDSTKTMLANSPWKSDVTLWDEIPHHKAVSQKACFQFLSEDISFAVIGVKAIRRTWPNRNSSSLQLPVPVTQKTGDFCIFNWGPGLISVGSVGQSVLVSCCSPTIESWSRARHRFTGEAQGGRESLFLVRGTETHNTWKIG